MMVKPAFFMQCSIVSALHVQCLMMPIYLIHKKSIDLITKIHLKIILMPFCAVIIMHLNSCLNLIWSKKKGFFI